MTHPAISAKDRRTFQILGVLAALAVLGFGAVYRAVMPAPFDPWLWRIVVAAACLVVTLVATFGRRRTLYRIAHAVYLLITGWITLLLQRNDFASEYAVGLVVIVAVIGALFRGMGAFTSYALTTLGMLAAAALATETPRLSPGLFGAYVALLLLLAYTVLRHRLRAEAELEESEERYELAVRGAQDGLWDWDLVRRTLHLSPRWKEIVGCADHEIAGDPSEWFDRIEPEDRPRVQAALFGHADIERDLFEVEHRMRHADGTHRWVLLRGARVTDDEGNVVRMAGSMKDISERKRFEARLLHDSLHDSLTGLPNRALFLDRLDRAIAYARRHADSRFAVCFLDVDRFKVVNDRLGHVTADRLLVAIAGRLAGALRQGDTVARLSGDEFALLLHDVDDPSLVTARLLDDLHAPFDVDGTSLQVTVSVGIALSSTGFDRPEDALRDADAAMYRAKSRGGGRVEIADPELHADSLHRLALEAELRDAIARSEWSLRFQPIVQLKSRVLVGFEALVRWNHPTRGLLGPDEFVPLAEQCGLIQPIGRWVLREACRQLLAWEQRRDGGTELWMSVNLSSRQFLDPQLDVEILGILAEIGFPPERLRIEITESLLLDDAALAGRTLERLRAAGVRVAVDDFGTGYSSLAYLHRLPVDTLKIDRSFIARMHEGPAQEAVVQTVISLSSRLSLDTVAEGVEHVDDEWTLHRMGCTLGQGFLFAHPLAADAAARLVSASAGGAPLEAEIPS